MKNQTAKLYSSILLEMLEQNKFTSSFSFDQINSENAGYRLNDKTASIGFIYRHIGETMNTFCRFLGIETDVVNTTLAQNDTGKIYDIETSRKLVVQGYTSLEKLIELKRLTRFGCILLIHRFSELSKGSVFLHIYFFIPRIIAAKFHQL